LLIEEKQDNNLNFEDLRTLEQVPQMQIVGGKDSINYYGGQRH